MPISSDVMRTTFAALQRAKPKSERAVGRGKRKMIGVTLKQIQKKQTETTEKKTDGQSKKR